MSDFDDDRILRDRLQRLAGSLPDERAAYAALQHQVRVAKRRRAGVASASLVALCVLALVMVNLPGRHHQTVTTATNEVSVPDVSVREPATTTSAEDTTSPATTSTSERPANTGSTAAPPPSVVAPDAPKPGAQPAASGTNAPGVSGATTSGTGSKTGPSPSSSAPTVSPVPSVPETDPPESTSPSTAPPVPSADETRTFTAAHGSITVQLHDGVLTLLADHAEDGYEYRLDRSDPDRIRVRFRSDQATSQIDVFITDGHLASTIGEQTSGQSAVAATTDDGTLGGSGHT